MKREDILALYADAEKRGYALGSFSPRNTWLIPYVCQAAQKKRAPILVQISSNELRWFSLTAREFAQAFFQATKDISVPVILHLDHTYDPQVVFQAIEAGFQSVMIDGSKLPFEENIALTKKVVEYAHDHGVVVEAELGTLAGVEDEVAVEHGKESYTHPEEVEEFVSRTGCDSLAIAIGTSHGAYKFTPEQCTRNADGVLVPPPLRFDVLEEVSKRLPGFPIVLHGSSSVPREFVDKINKFGGKMPDAIGIPEEELRHAAQLSVCKINIDSDIRLAITASIREHFAEHPDHFDPRQYLKPARQAVKDMVTHKLINVLGCNGKA